MEGLAAFEYYEQIGSTNDAAKEWLEDGGKGVFAAFANEQKQGRGRSERRWESPADSAISLSLAFSTGEIPTEVAPLLAGVAGIAVAKGVKQLYQVEMQLKWPNDLLVEGLKVGGILIESEWRGGADMEAVIGIGINVASSSIADSQAFRFPAGYVEQFIPGPVSREELVPEIVEQLLQLIHEGKPAEILRQWNGSLAYKDESIEFSSAEGQRFSGVLKGINEAGCLILEGDGLEQSYSAGEIQINHP